jgi:hypothetical protein
MSAKTTKKAQKASRRRAADDDLAPEYRFDYAAARPNRYTRKMAQDAIVVVLDPDVAEVFHDSRCVNDLLRTMIRAVGKRRTRRTG